MKNQQSKIQRMVGWSADSLLAWRKPLMLLFILITVALGYSATGIRLDPGFNKQIPVNHPFMKNFLHYSETFSGANNVLVSVRWKGEGDIYNPEFLAALRKVTDEVFFIPGVRRASGSSLFTPDVRYIEVTEQGYLVMWLYRRTSVVQRKIYNRCAETLSAPVKLANWWPMISVPLWCVLTCRRLTLTPVSKCRTWKSRVS